jgi:L-arabinonolactonase
MSKTLASATGRLYRVDPDLSVTVVADGIWLPNSIAWSPDWRRMYFADSHLRTIFVYDFDLDDGAIADRRVFAACEHPGVPDGSAVDADGFLWNAMFDGGCIIRYAPDGRVDRVLELPVTRPTSCTFGGDDLATLYITTARFRLPPETLAREPHTGGVLAVDVGVRGLVEPLFGG